MSEYELADEAATLQFGARLVAALRRLPAPRAEQGAALKLWLRGELGSGKTTLARGILAALGATGMVRSPSYTLIENYAVPPWRVVHMDFYRLRSAEEVAALGLAEFDYGDCLWLLEWPDNAFGTLPDADAEVALSYVRRGRSLRLSARSERGRRWLEQLELVSIAH